VDLEFLYFRGDVLRLIRSFFDGKAYLEVDTPVLAPDLIPESCLEAFETSYLTSGGQGRLKKKPYWLVPSPEIWMKKLISRHRKSMYQICKCFRNGESVGFLHSPEFTMLEYYTMDFNYLDSLNLTEELFGVLGKELSREETGNLFKTPFLRMTMEEAFKEFAGIDLYARSEAGALNEDARRLGLDLPLGLDTQEFYDLIFIHAVESKLPKDRIVALLDYPAFVPCLAKKGKDGKTMERWELYGGGVELANCFTEENDGEEVRRYFEAEGKIKNKSALVPHLIDEDYWKLFASNRGFPPCSGVAMGVDRLIMALSGRKCIDEVLPFPMDAAVPK
jgi:lysyl-tRNA synthetase class 2